MSSVFIDTANAAGTRWAVWITSALLDSTILLALVGSVWFTIRKRVPPHVGYCLFLLIPLKVLLPIPVMVPAAIANWTPSTQASKWLTETQAVNVLAKQVEEETLNPAERPAMSPTLKGTSDAASQLAETDAVRVIRPEAILAPVQPEEFHASESPRQTGQRPSLSVTAWLAILWLAGVVTLAGRLILSQFHFRSVVNRSRPIELSHMGIDLPALCRSAGVRQTVSILASESISAPAVYGIFRPTILMSKEITSALTTEQLKWALLHELAHIKRKDLLVVLLQRMALILHFFNPAVWIANRIVYRLREFACDDLAISLNDGSPMDPGEAFLQILRFASQRPVAMKEALGIFGLDSRAACLVRIERLLDFKRSIRTRSGPGTVLSLVLFSVLVIPHLYASGDDQPASQTESPKKNTTTPDSTQAVVSGPIAMDDKTAKETGKFELQVVGPDGKPVPSAKIDLRSSDVPAEGQFERGQFIKKHSYGVDVMADGQGQVTVKLPQVPARFELLITTPGYGPYWASWQADQQALPGRFQVELDAGWSVGGIIVDEQDKPIAGVTIHPFLHCKNRPGEQKEIGLGSSAKTDASGKWQFDSVPVSKSEVTVEINHPDFMPGRQQLSRSEYGLKSDQGPVSKIVLKRGLTVTGKITDESGKPIAGALIRAKFLNLFRQATSGTDGVYRLEGCEPVETRIVVSAKGRALDMREVRLDPEMEPLDFQMQPGGKIRVRVLDDQEKPVSKAYIFPQTWRGQVEYFEFRHVKCETNQDGIWEWDEAPLDEFEADIGIADRMNLAHQPLKSRAEEYVFRLPPALVVTGNVIDAATRKPIQRFKVVPGIRSSKDHMNWVRGEIITGVDGQYRMRQNYDYFAYLVRIEADGYRPSVSRDIKSNEGHVTIDFELSKGQDFAGIVLSPDGRPAAKAKLALAVAGSQISMENGDLPEGSGLSLRQDTNGAGQFRFPPQETRFRIVVVHPSGYAHLIVEPEAIPGEIRLNPWARLEGQFRVGSQAVSGVPITLNTIGFGESTAELGSLFVHYDVVTGQEGRFQFERVIPGPAFIGRRIMLTVDDGALDVTSSAMVPVTIAERETNEILLGGSGRPVVGKLQPPAGFAGMPKWHFAVVNVRTYFAPLPEPQRPPIPADAERDPKKKVEWWLKWQQTDAGKAWLAWRGTVDRTRKLQESSPYFTATVNRDGSFRIDDMPPGQYVLSVQFDRDRVGNLWDRRFTVPAPDPGEPADQTSQQIDLGVLRLQKP